MAVTRKVESIAALRLESGKSATIGKWGGTAQPLSAGHAIAYTEFPVNGLSETIVDDSIEGQGFQDIPNQVQTSAEGTISGRLRYEGLDRFWYWAMGFEHPDDSPLVEYLFTVSGVTDNDPSIGSTWTNNSSTFTIREENISGGSGTVRMERTAGSNDPLTGPDTLTKTGGTGDATMSYDPVSAKKQGHLLELDKHERHLTVYRSGEGTVAGGDRKNRMATIAKARGTNDFRYRSAMCKRISFSSAAGEAAKFSADFIAFDEVRGSFSSGSWTFPTGGSGSSLNVLHHHFKVSIGPSGSLVATGVSSFEITVDIPLQQTQDTESGLNIIEPVLEGKYTVTATLTLPRHDADTFLVNRDSFTDIAMKLVATLGDRELSFYLSDMRVSEASVSDDDIGQIPITFVNGPDSTASPFIISPTGSLNGYTITQGSPLIVLAKNTNATNEMRRET